MYFQIVDYFCVHKYHTKLALNIASKRCIYLYCCSSGYAA
jgi:hypothetical protein